MSAWWLAAAAAVAVLSTWWLTGLVRQYAVRRAMVDMPGPRSSHEQPTPRGGGIALVAVVLVFLAGLRVLGLIDDSLSLALGVGGALVAGVGWFDDHGHAPVRLRFVVHGIAAAWAVAWLGGIPGISIGHQSIALGWFGLGLAALGVVWLINLYNFMDGIDGVAALEAVSVGLIASVLLLVASFPGLAALSLVVAGAAAGFLIRNWSPAQIFMGDSGSGFLGYTFAALMLASERAGAVPLLVWLLMLAVFVVDASTTLVRRMIRREKWHQPHKRHAYQRMVQAGYTHREVSGTVGLLNVVLGLLAGWAVHRPSLMLPAAITGFAVIAAAYVLVERVAPMGASGS